MSTADVVVVGVGAMGSAAAYQLAKAGLRVVAIDRFSPPHDRGSSHGETRITREAIGEGSAYVPLVRRSHAIWREIEAETGEDLLLACGALVISRGANAARHHGKEHFLDQTIAAAERFAIPHERLAAAEIAARYPQLGLVGDERGYHEPGGGLVHPERCIAAQIALARRHGAEIRAGERVRQIEQIGGGVRVTTDRGVYEAGQAILAAGAWIPELAGPAVGRLAVHRQVLFWYEPADPAPYRSDRFPVFIWMHGEGDGDYFYGFPIPPGDSGVKVATETYVEALADPDGLDRNVAPAEEAAMHAAHVAGRLRGVSATCLRARSCLYTVTPDSDFVIDRHPDQDRVLVVSACSGHGFKHSAAIGECVAEIVAAGRSRTDLSAFALGRPDRASTGGASTGLATAAT